MMIFFNWAALGLVKAINHYQAQYQVRFSAYAVHPLGDTGYAG